MLFILITDLSIVYLRFGNNALAANPMLLSSSRDEKHASPKEEAIRA